MLSEVEQEIAARLSDAKAITFSGARRTAAATLRYGQEKLMAEKASRLQEAEERLDQAVRILGCINCMGLVESFV